MSPLFDIQVLVILTNLLGVAVCTDTECRKMTTHYGTDFLLGFMKMYKETNITLSISAQTSGIIYLESKVPGINTSRPILKGVTEFNVSTVLHHNQLGLDNKGLLLKSSSDVAVYIMHRSDEWSYGEDISLAFPVETLSNKYVISSAKPWRANSNLRSHFILVALQDNTHVNITLNVQKIITYNNINYSHGDIIQVLVGKLGTFYLETSGDDLSGTVIESDKPLAVFAGSDGTEMPQDVSDVDFVTSQLLPVTIWGTSYIVPPLYPSPHFFVGLYAYYKGTVISIYNHTSTNSKLLNKGEVWKVIGGNDSMVVRSSLPIQVIQFATSSDYDRLQPADIRGDPFMTIVPAINQYSSEYTFPTETLSIQHPKDPFNNFATITVNTSLKSGLLVDGVLVDVAYAQILHESQVSSPSEGFSVLTLNIYNGPHSFQHSDKNVKFAATIYGRIYAIGYGFPAGMVFPSKGCPVTPVQRSGGTAMQLPTNIHTVVLCLVCLIRSVCYTM